jgi:hypothetical protein
MCFDCDQWRLKITLDLPPRFNGAAAELAAIGSRRRHFLFVRTGSDGRADSLLHYDAATGACNWHEAIAGKSVLQAQLFDDQALVVYGEPDGTHGRLATIDLAGGTVDTHLLSRLLDGRTVLTCGQLYVADAQTGPVFFKARCETDDGIESHIFRFKSTYGEAITASSYPPGRLVADGNRHPFPMAAGPDKDYYDLYVGRLLRWRSKEPGLVLGYTGPQVDPARMRDTKKLVRIPFSERLMSMALFVSPDGRYVLFLQASLDDPPSEGLIAVDMESGRQTPILLHETHGGHGFFDLYWVK